MKVGVAVCVNVGVWVWVKVEVEVGVLVAVTVGVAVAAETVCRFPVTVPPVKIAPCPVVWPLAEIPPVARLFEKFLFPKPDMLRSNTSSIVCACVGPKVTKPDRLVKVTAPPLKVCDPNTSVSGPVVYKPFGDPSWYNLTLPAATSVPQFRVPPPVNINCFTTTFSCAVEVSTNCRLETLAWLKL